MVPGGHAALALQEIYYKQNYAFLYGTFSFWLATTVYQVLWCTPQPRFVNQFLCCVVCERESGASPLTSRFTHPNSPENYPSTHPRHAPRQISNTHPHSPEHKHSNTT